MNKRTQLLAFLAADEKPTDPVRIMKGLFLVSRAVEEGKLPHVETFPFEPLIFGPCSMEVYRQLDDLVAEGLVRAEPVPGETWKRYTITDAGIAEVQHHQKQDDAPIEEFEKRVRTWCDQQSFSDLLRAIYHAYPDFAINSVLPHLRPNK